MALQLRSKKLSFAKIIKLCRRSLGSQKAERPTWMKKEFTMRHGFSYVVLCEHLQSMLQNATQLSSTNNKENVPGCSNFTSTELPNRDQAEVDSRLAELDYLLGEDIVKSSVPFHTLLDRIQGMHQCVIPHSYTDDDMLIGLKRNCTHEHISANSLRVEEFLKYESQYSMCAKNNLGKCKDTSLSQTKPNELSPLSVQNNIMDKHEEIPDIIKFCDMTREDSGVISRTNISVDFAEISSNCGHQELHQGFSTLGYTSNNLEMPSFLNADVSSDGLSPNIVHFKSTSTVSAEASGSSTDPSKPTSDQLLRAKDKLAEVLPVVLNEVHDYKMYTQDIILENNFVKKPYIKVGINAYASTLIKLRFWVHVRYANVRVFLLSGSHNQEEGSITFRWRISGLPNSQAFMFWKFLPWNYRKSLDENSVWYDGISTFYVNSEGFIYKHRVDRIEKDEQQDTAKDPVGVLGKLAMSVGSGQSKLGETTSNMCDALLMKSIGRLIK